MGSEGNLRTGGKSAGPRPVEGCGSWGVLLVVNGLGLATIHQPPAKNLRVTVTWLAQVPLERENGTPRLLSALSHFASCVAAVYAFLRISALDLRAVR